MHTARLAETLWFPCTETGCRDYYPCLGALRAMCYAYGACIMRCVSRACRPCSVPGFPAKGLHLEHDIFSQAGKTGPSAHQVHSEKLPRQVRHDRPTETSRNGRYMADAPGGAPPSNSTPLSGHCPRCDRQLCSLEDTNPGRADFPGCPGYPLRMRLDGNHPITWSKPCALCCQTLVAGTTTWSRKLQGEFISM